MAGKQKKLPETGLATVNGANLPAKFDFDEGDLAGYTDVAPQIIYSMIRNEDLEDDNGKIIRPRGTIYFRDNGWREGKNRPDVTELVGVVFAESQGAICFESGELLCKSSDRKSGSRAAETRNEAGRNVRVFGSCGDCFYQRNGGESGRSKCRINRPLGFLQVEDNKLVDAFIFNLTPGSEGPWRVFEGELHRYVSRASGKSNVTKVPHHRFLIRITPQYIKPDKKGISPYYAAKFEPLDVTSGDLRKAVAKQRAILGQIFAQMQEAEEPEVQDYFRDKTRTSGGEEETPF